MFQLLKMDKMYRRNVYELCIININIVQLVGGEMCVCVCVCVIQNFNTQPQKHNIFMIESKVK